MSRLQLALTVSDVDAAVAWYTQLFGVEPTKRREGYANFAVVDPPLKLVLIEGESGGTLNHLGVEVDSTAEVRAATARLAEAGLADRTEEGVDCCYAIQDKVWAHDPDGAPWEIYTVLEDAPATSTLAGPGDGVATASGRNELPRAAACCAN